MERGSGARSDEELQEVLNASRPGRGGGAINEEGDVSDDGDDYDRYLGPPTDDDDDDDNGEGYPSAAGAARSLRASTSSNRRNGADFTPARSSRLVSDEVGESREGAEVVEGSRPRSSLSGEHGSPASPRTRAERVELGLTRNPSSKQLRSGCSKSRGIRAAERVAAEMRELLEVFDNHLHWTSRAFVALAVAAGIVVISISVFMLVLRLTSSHEERVTDETSVCYGVSFDEGVVGGSVMYTIAVFAFNGVSCAWFAFRAVQMEKAGNLFCFLVAAVFQVGRVVYFCFGGTLTKYYDALDATIILWVLLGSLLLLLAAASLTYSVRATFGWLTYAKGVTKAKELKQLQQHMRFDTALKLDSFVTINALISVVFLVDTLVLQVAGVVITSVSVIILLLLKIMVRRKHTWFLLLTIVVGLLSPAFYVWCVVTMLVSTNVAECSRELTTCLSGPLACVSPVPCPWMNINVTVGSAADAGMLPFVPSNATNGEGFVIQGCPAAACFSQNIGVILLFIANCCGDLGHCGMLNDLRVHDKALMILIAVAAVLARAASLILGFVRRREMELPSVQEMFERAERNLMELRRAARQVRNAAALAMPLSRRRMAETASDIYESGRGDSAFIAASADTTADA